MSLENEIKKLTETITLLISKLDFVEIERKEEEVTYSLKQEPVKVEEPVIEVKPEVAVDMPAPPSFAPTTSVITQPTAPFSDTKGLSDYAMASYKALGPQKGLGIQTILVKFGYQSLNQIKPEQYYEFYKQVEALKNE